VSTCLQCLDVPVSMTCLSPLFVDCPTTSDVKTSCMYEKTRVSDGRTSIICSIMHLINVIVFEFYHGATDHI
jgi:hypothetical protein